jgi:hypothetical protein
MKRISSRGERINAVSDSCGNTRYNKMFWLGSEATVNDEVLPCNEGSLVTCKK